MAKEPATNDNALSVRWAVVLMFAALVGIGGGVLTYAGIHSAALAVFAGFASFAGGWAFAKDLISTATED